MSSNIDAGPDDSESSSEDEKPEKPETPVERELASRWNPETQTVERYWKDGLTDKEFWASKGFSFEDSDSEVGTIDESNTDESILDESPAVKKSIEANKAAEDLTRSIKSTTMQSTPTSPRLTAMNGNFTEEDDVFDDEPNTSDRLSTIDADVPLPIDRFAPYRFTFDE